MNRQKGVFARGSGLGPAVNRQGKGCEDSASDSNACIIASHLLRWSVDDTLGDFRAIAETRARASDGIGTRTRAGDSIGAGASASVINDTSPTTSPLTSQPAPPPPPPLSCGTYFDVVVAADCLFFTDFHDALIDTIKTALTPPPSASASSDVPSSSTSSLFTPVAYLLQPRRGGTMETFMRKVKPLHQPITYLPSSPPSPKF